MNQDDTQFAQEASAIQALVGDYFGGIFHGDVERLRRAFHPTAALHGDVNGQPYLRSLEEYLEIVRNRRSPATLDEPFRMRVLAIEQLNDIAVVRLRCPMLGFDYVDFLALRKIEGQWCIVSKLLANVSQ